MKNIKRTKIIERNKKTALEILKKYKIYKLITNNKKYLNILTQIFTGHSHLNHSRNNRVKERNTNCKYCKNTRETTEHYIGECPAYSNIMTNILGKHKISVEKLIKQNQIKDIISYIKETKSFDNIED